MGTNGTIERVKDTIYEACMLLDDEHWADWLSMCDKKFQYDIKAFSPEINTDMTYFSATRSDLETMTSMLSKLNTDHSSLRRHSTVYKVTVDKDKKTAKAITSLVVYQNLLDGVNSHIEAGSNKLFLLGRYIDTMKVSKDRIKFLSREVRLDTRQLERGSHWPI